MKTVLWSTLRSRWAFVAGFCLLCLRPAQAQISFLSAPTEDTGSTRRLLASGNFKGNGRIQVVESDANSLSLSEYANGAHFVTPNSISVPIDVNAAAVGDFNKDGHLDLVTVTRSPEADVYLGDGKGGLKFTSQIWIGPTPKDVAVGDLDGDGNPDIVVVCNTSDSVNVILGNGDGTFQTPANFPAGHGPVSLVIGDFNRDHIPDLAVAANSNNNDANRIVVMLGRGDGSFAPGVEVAIGTPGGYHAACVKTADFNGDGIADLVALDQTFYTASVVVLLGKGDGSFLPAQSYPVGQFPDRIVTADFDQDGRQDMLVENVNSGSLSLFLGDGKGGFLPRKDYSVGVIAGLMQVADFDGDGLLDVVLHSGLGQGFLRTFVAGRPHGNFEAAASFTPEGWFQNKFAVGDFNGDGLPDLVTGNSLNASLSVLKGTVTGEFQPLTTFPTVRGCIYLITGDFNQDQKVDVASLDSFGVLNIYLGKGNGTFQSGIAIDIRDTIYATFLQAGDFNGDGKIDLLVGSANGGRFAIFLNTGKGTFQNKGVYKIGGYLHAAVLGDFNEDGKTDIFVTDSEHQKLHLYLGQGDGTFPAVLDYSIGQSAFNLISGDFNGDGHLDLIAQQWSGAVMLQGNGRGGFTQPYPPFGVGSSLSGWAVGDLDKDGLLDLALINLAEGDVVVLAGNGDGTFCPAQHFTAGYDPSALALGDFNHDGKLDLLTANRLGGNMSLLLNTTTAPSHRTLSGHVRLEGCVRPEEQTLWFEFRSETGDYVEKFIKPAPDGSFSFPNFCTGHYTAAIRGDRWLWKMVPLDLTAAGDNLIDVTLSPGDLNFDNVIEIDDLVLFFDAYGSMPGDANWYPPADLTCDDVVDLDDLVLFFTHYGEAGDP